MLSLTSAVEMRNAGTVTKMEHHLQYVLRPLWHLSEGASV